jgi:hypothetical protein
VEICRSITELPMRPAVYAIYGGSYPPRQYAYVGIGEKLRNRIRQHLVLRDSSVATTAAVAGLRVEHVTGVVWWEHPSFTLNPAPTTGRRDDRPLLEASERVADEILRPTLRSRGQPRAEAQAHLQDEAFREEMAALFRGEPSGRLHLPTLPDLVDQVAALEQRISQLEERLRE